MKKINKILLFSGLSLLLASNVSAKVVKTSEIPAFSYIVGPHLFTSDDNPILNTTGMDTIYNEVIGMHTKLIMYASPQVDGAKMDEMEIYYTLGDGLVGSGIDGKEYNPAPESFDILYVNGICIDPSCEGNVYNVKFKALAPYIEETNIKVNYGEKIKEESVPKVKPRLGYKFVCWTKEGSEECFDINALFDEKLMGKENKDLVLEAKWEQITYNVTYNTNFGEPVTQNVTCTSGNEGDMALNCKFGNYDILFKENKNPNYKFLGWSTTKDGKTLYNEDTAMDAILTDNKDITLYAIWGTTGYSVKYDLVGGTFVGQVSPTIEFNNETANIKLPVVTKVGYEFKEWQYKGSKFDGNTLPKEDITLTAIWTPIVYSFNYGSKKVSCTYDQVCEINVVDSKVPEGKEFVRWYIMDQDSKVYIGNKVKNFSSVAKDFTLVPEYKDLTYNITYNYDGGVVSQANKTTFKFNKGDTVTLNAPTKKGYKFIKWIVSPGATIQGNILTINKANDITVTATYEANDIIISYNNDEGLVNSQSCIYPDCVLNETDPVKEGFEFDGWLSAKTGLVYKKGSKLSLDELSSKASETYVVNLIAKWTNKYRYVISYDLDGGVIGTESALAPTTFLKDENLLLPVPTKKGYTFKGYNINGTTHTASEDGKVHYTTEGKDVKVKAVFEANKYSIKFYPAEGKSADVINVVQCTYDKPCSFGTHDISLKYPNQELIGWSTTHEGKLFYGDNLTVLNLTDANNKVIDLFAITRDTTVKHNVSIYLDGGTFGGSSVPSTIVDGQTLSLPTPTKENYTFVEWMDTTTNLPYAGGAVKKDVYLVAKWEIKKAKINYQLANGDVIKVDPTLFPTTITKDQKVLYIPGGKLMPQGTTKYKVNGVDLELYQTEDGILTDYYVLNVPDGKLADITVVAYKPEPPVKVLNVTYKLNDTSIDQKIPLEEQRPFIETLNVKPGTSWDYKEDLVVEWTTVQTFDINGVTVNGEAANIVQGSDETKSKIVVTRASIKEASDVTVLFDASVKSK